MGAYTSVILSPEGLTTDLSTAQVERIATALGTTGCESVLATPVRARDSELFLSEPVSLEQAVGEWSSGRYRCLHCGLGYTAWARTLVQEQEAEIPEVLRNGFLAWDVGLTFGVDDACTESTGTVGSPHGHIRLSGDGNPVAPDEYITFFAELPAIRELMSALRDTTAATWRLVADISV